MPIRWIPFILSLFVHGEENEIPHLLEYWPSSEQSMTKITESQNNVDKCASLFVTAKNGAMPGRLSDLEALLNTDKF